MGDFDRNAEPGWSSTIVTCSAAAQVAGSKKDQAIWAYEERELRRDRDDGWPSDNARINNARDASLGLFEAAGPSSAQAQLTSCQQQIAMKFPAGHPAQ